MPNGHRYAGSDGSAAVDAEVWRSPGKRTLTESIQRKVADAASVHPLVPVPTSTSAAPEAIGLSCEQSYLDSLLDGPVQRKADGEAATEDVHALAEAGTAGAGAALPFLDEIQASFGGHDVTGVQAHTGAEAASSAAGMGATAFATGNHVAFAGNPDLHTAAHEAAHVVQQRAGVHLKGGVGAEGDQYEEHADAVADAVVRGESAESMLGAPAGARAAGTKVQHKASRSQGTGPLRDDDTLETGSLVTSLKAAQHALDETTAKADAATVQAQLALAQRHIGHALEVAALYGGRKGEEAVKTGLDHLAEALDQFQERTKKTANEQVVQSLWGVVHRLHQQVGHELYAAKPRGYRPELGSDASYVEAAVPEAFDLAAHRSAEALGALERIDGKTPDHPARDGIARDYARRITESAGHVGWLLQQLPEERRPEFKAHGDRAADQLHAVVAWIRSRTSNREMRSLFEGVTRQLDYALMLVGAPMVDSRPLPALRGGEDGEAVDERADLVLAEKQLSIALRDLRDAKIQKGIEPFHDLAALEENADPTFMAELAKAILVASIGHLAGAVAGPLLAAAATKVPKISAEAIAKISDVTIDSVQGITGKVADGAFQEASKDKNTKTRARTFFVAGLKQEASLQQSSHEEMVAKDIAAGASTAAILREEAALVRAMVPMIGTQYLQKAAASWASYLAQGHLGTKGPRDQYGRKASEMKEYFGEPRPSGDRVFGTGNINTDGVLRLVFDVDTDRSKRSARSAVILRSTEVAGLNDDMKALILAEAGGDLDKIWLPKEISVYMRPGYTRAFLAGDERGKLRDHMDWDGIKYNTTHIVDRSLQDPESFWEKHVKGRKLSAS